MSLETTTSTEVPEISGLKPDGSELDEIKNSKFNPRKLFLPVGLSILSIGLLVGINQISSVSANEIALVSKPTPESKMCAQVITRAKNRVTNEIRCFPDTCFSREVWEELPSAAGCDEPTIYKIFVPSVNNSYLQPDDDYPRVGPRPLPYP